MFFTSISRMGDKLQMCHPEFISGSKRELKGGGYCVSTVKC